MGEWQIIPAPKIVQSRAIVRVHFLAPIAILDRNLPANDKEKACWGKILRNGAGGVHISYKRHPKYAPKKLDIQKKLTPYRAHGILVCIL